MKQAGIQCVFTCKHWRICTPNYKTINSQTETNDFISTYLLEDGVVQFELTHAYITVSTFNVKLLYHR